MKLFFDTEFTGLRQDTTLISIGIVSEDKKQFYAEFTDYDPKQCNDWITANVIQHLYTKQNKPLYIEEFCIGTRQEIAVKLEKWLQQFDSIELVSDVCHYDMVLLMELFGGALYCPNHICPVCYDINQDIAKVYQISMKDAFDMPRERILKEKGIVIEGEKHNAIYDAKVIQKCYYLLKEGIEIKINPVEIIKQIKEGRKRERELLEEIATVAGIAVAFEASRRFDHRKHLYSHTTYINQLETLLTLLKKGIKKEIALNWAETNQKYVAEYLKNISEEPL